MQISRRRQLFYGGTLFIATAVAVLHPAGEPMIAATAQPTVASAAAAPEYPVPSDRDGDVVVDTADACPTVAGNLKNGCPGELNADVVGRWRVNALLTQLISLSVRAPTGSAIQVRCSSKVKRVCSFKTRTIANTRRRVTSLTRSFKGRRILPANVTIVVRVTRPEQLGVYQRLRTRVGRRLPSKTQRCISPAGKVAACL